MQNRNRKAECDVCHKLMRSDNLKRHKQTHRDLLSLPDNEFKNELETRQEIKKKQEEKIQKIENIAKENKFQTKLQAESANLLRKWRDKEKMNAENVVLHLTLHPN